MSYLDSLLRSQYVGGLTADLGLKPGDAFASYFNPTETSAPTYSVPNPWITTNIGYLQNEFVYSIIIKRGTAEAEGRLRVNQKGATADTNKPVQGHDLVELIHHPNEGMTEDDFWGIKRIFQDISGFSAWEIERNNLGEPMRLWPMLPHYCAFLRGQKKPLRAIRYQPYGLPYQDIPFFDDEAWLSGETPEPDPSTRRILFFSNAEDYHPLYPNIRYYSPTMHALPQIESDNAATFFLKDFWEHGTKVPGILSVAQSIDENTARDYQRRWMETHGGKENFNKPAVMGLGTTFTPTNMNFRDMVFTDLDGRTESRICNTFQIPVIVADARVGQQVSSYNNKKQATTDWYHDWVTNAWDKNAESMTEQMLPIYGNDPHDFYCDFDTSHVYAIQEDEDLLYKRVDMVWKDRIITLDQALTQLKLPPVGGDEGKSRYVALAVRNQEAINPEGEVTAAAAAAQEGKDQQQADQQQPPKKKTAQQEEEVKKFRAFAKKRVKEGKLGDIPEYEFKFASPEQQAALLAEFGITTDALALARSIELTITKLENANS